MNPTAHPSPWQSLRGTFVAKFRPAVDHWLRKTPPRSLEQLSAEAKIPLGLLQCWYKGDGVPSHKTLHHFHALAETIGIDVVEYIEETELRRLKQLTRREAAAIRRNVMRSMRVGNRAAEPADTGERFNIFDTNIDLILDWLYYELHLSGFSTKGIPGTEPRAPETITWRRHQIRLYFEFLVRHHGFSPKALRLPMLADAALVKSYCNTRLTKPGPGGTIIYIPSTEKFLAFVLGLLHDPALGETKRWGTKDTIGWLWAQPDLVLLDHFQGQFPAEIERWDRFAEVFIPMKPDFATEAGRKRAWRWWCGKQYGILGDFFSYSKKHTGSVKRKHRGRQAEPLREFLATDWPAELLEEFFAGLLLRAETARTELEVFRAAQDLAHFPVMTCIAVRTSNWVEGKLVQPGQPIVGPSIGRVSPESRQYFITWGRPVLKNRKQAMAEGGIQLRVPSIMVGQYDICEFMSYWEMEMRPRALAWLGRSSEYFYIPLGLNGVLKKGASLPPPNADHMSQRFAEMAVTILGPKAVPFTAGRARHLTSTIWQSVDRPENAPLHLRNRPQTCAGRYLKYGEFVRQVKAQNAVHALVHPKPWKPHAPSNPTAGLGGTAGSGPPVMT